MAAISFVGRWTVTNIDRFLVVKMGFCRGGNAQGVSPVPYKGRRKPKNCISGRGGSIWSIKALQNSFMEDQSCARRQPLRLGGGSRRNDSPFPSWLGKPKPPPQAQCSPRRCLPGDLSWAHGTFSVWTQPRPPAGSVRGAACH